MSTMVVMGKSSPGINFVYVNANTGEAAGGHTALRLGETVFHYQFYENGNFLLVRETWDHFRFIYNELRNRSIFTSFSPLDSATYTQLRHHFTGILMAQQLTLKCLEENKTQLQFIENLIDGHKNLRLSGLGLFERYDSGNRQTTKLQDDIKNSLGSDFLDHEKERLNHSLESPETFINNQQSIKKFLEWLTLREALQVLEANYSIMNTAIIKPLQHEAKLTLIERNYLREHKKHLRTSIIGLLQSTRPDRGSALLRQIARYQTLQRSLASNHFLTLDPFSEKARHQPVTNAEISSGILQQTHNQLLNIAKSQRDIFFSGADYPEITYSFLEASRGRLHELEQALNGAKTIRVELDPLRPSRSRNISLTTFNFDPTQLKLAATELKRIIKIQQLQLKQKYSYHLVNHNCATKLVESLNNPDANSASKERTLGEYLAQKQNLTFVPFIFYARAQQANSKLSEPRYLPSRRLRKLRDLHNEEGGLKVWLRENNTLSSTLYDPRAQDTPFLFFTDDAKFPRPLEGIANFCYAALHGTIGILTLPFDGGNRLYQSVRGMFYSLPELFFWNIRKGTYAAAELAGSKDQ
ncbi:hypothetical protein KAI46_14480 [bacterium]|nr:hypothetical protein [bacterium]